MKDSYKTYNAHVKRIIILFVIVAALYIPIKWLFTPASFNEYGHFRGDAITEEAAIVPRHMTNESCSSCHEYEFENLINGLHNTLSCEFCHGPYIDHISDNKKTAPLPVKEGNEITVLCLRCHNNNIMARPKDMIKTIIMPDHLRNQQVSETHSCNQCHYVHAPLEYINRGKQVNGRQERVDG